MSQAGIQLGPSYDNTLNKLQYHCTPTVAPSLLARPPHPSIFNQTVDDTTPPRHNSSMTNALNATFAALADPTRRAILSMLLEDDMAVTDVAAPFSMSLAAISKHLQALADAGLISQEKRGRVNWCKLEPDALRAASVWMQGFGQFEPVNLDAFERFLMTELADVPEETEASAPAANPI
jgi:DNA-binding transcriptional ArsR family regulator